MIFLYATPEEGLVGEEVLSAEETLCVGLTPDFLNKTVDLLAARRRACSRSSTTVSVGRTLCRAHARHGLRHRR